MKTKKITIISIILAFVLIISSTAILISSCTEKTEEPEEITQEVTQEVKATAPETTEYVDPYAHVRFGETDNILLLDIEWHTYDTWLEEIEEYKNYIDERKKSDYYTNLSDEEKKEYDASSESWIKQWEEYTENITP